MDSAGDLLLTLGSSPIAIACAIVVATFVLEDVTTVAAALLAASGVVPPSVALGALVFGIFVGDLGLYALGAGARTRPWARTWIGEARMAQGSSWLKQRLAGALISARFLPGFRLPVYTASGFLGIPFLSFAAITAGAGVVWTGLVFGIVFGFGAMAFEELGPWKWAVGASVLLAALLWPLAARSVGLASAAIPLADTPPTGELRCDRRE